MLISAAALWQAAGAARPKLVVVDDLPHAAGPDARRRLASALGELAATTRFPVVVVTTEAGGSGGGGRPWRRRRQLPAGWPGQGVCPATYCSRQPGNA